MTLPSLIARCEREIEACREACSSDPYAIQGELDWMVAQEMYEEELAEERKAA